MNFDLNINNYTKDELKEMFDLPPFYTKSIVESKELKLKQNILNNSTINEETKEKTIHFLIKAKNCILDQLSFDNNTAENNEYKSYYKLEPIELDKNSFENPIQKKSETSYVSSYPSEYYAGIINPIKKRFIKKNLIIDTKFRDNYYNTSSTNFNITLPTSFNDVIELQLTSIELPISYYAISKQFGNNYFNLSVTPASGSGTQETTCITIPDGNYDQFSVIEKINNSLDSLGSPFNLIKFVADLATSVSSNSFIGSGRTIVGEKVTGTVDSFELNFQADNVGDDDKTEPLPLKLGWLLGFRNGVYVNNLNYVSEGIIDVTGPKYIFLVLDDYNNSVSKNFYSALNSSILNNNILAQLPLIKSSSFTFYVENSFLTTPRTYFGPVNLLNLSIQLMDEYGRILNLNNMDYSFSIILTCIYDL